MDETKCWYSYIWAASWKYTKHKMYCGIRMVNCMKAATFCSALFSDAKSKSYLICKQQLSIYYTQTVLQPKCKILFWIYFQSLSQVLIQQHKVFLTGVFKYWSSVWKLNVSILIYELCTGCFCWDHFPIFAHLKTKTWKGHSKF